MEGFKLSVDKMLCDCENRLRIREWAVSFRIFLSLNIIE